MPKQNKHRKHLRNNKTVWTKRLKRTWTVTEEILDIHKEEAYNTSDLKDIEKVRKEKAKRHRALSKAKQFSSKAIPKPKAKRKAKAKAKAKAQISAFGKSRAPADFWKMDTGNGDIT